MIARAVRTSCACVLLPMLLDSGKAICIRVVWVRKVVLYMKKISSTTMMSMSDTMGICGTGRRRVRRFMGYFARCTSKCW